MELGRANPYGVYDLAHNNAWVSVGTDNDTASFAVSTIQRWWRAMGRSAYPDDEENLTIRVSHFPPGTSKWNKIEHRLFSHISMNWRARPLVSHEVIVSLIGATTTKKGLKVRAELDSKLYQKGIKVSDQEFKKIRIVRDDFHGEWNYVITPNPM